MVERLLSKLLSLALHGYIQQVQVMNSPAQMNGYFMSENIFELRKRAANRDDGSEKLRPIPWE